MYLFLAAYEWTYSEPQWSQQPEQKQWWWQNITAERKKAAATAAEKSIDIECMRERENAASSRRWGEREERKGEAVVLASSPSLPPRLTRSFWFTVSCRPFHTLVLVLSLASRIVQIVYLTTFSPWRPCPGSWLAPWSSNQAFMLPEHITFITGATHSGVRDIYRCYRICWCWFLLHHNRSQDRQLAAHEVTLSHPEHPGCVPAHREIWPNLHEETEILWLEDPPGHVQSLRHCTQCLDGLWGKKKELLQLPDHPKKKWCHWHLT